MNDLVEVGRDFLYVDSHLVAKKFGMQHKDLIITANRVIEKIGKLTGGVTPPKYIEETRHYRGTDFTVYLMSREFFSLVAMRLTSQKAFEWQVKFNDAFYAMEKRLLQVEQNKVDVEWNQTRLIGKTARIEETDAIKEFAEYATKQGSKNAKMYYKHVTNASYKALGMIAGKHPKLRDEMNLYQLSELMLAERLAANKLREYMDLNRNYHDIYSSVKQDLINFADSIRLVSK